MIEFKDRSFCFTGKLADLKRSQAEREARARGGHTTDVVNDRLHFLVVGSIPSTGWKHGSYGNKIEAARALRASGSTYPSIVPEDAFLDALAMHAPENSGAIDTQVFVATYRFVASAMEDFDRSAVEALIERLASGEEFIVRARAHSIAARSALFGETGPPDGVSIEIRFIKQLPLATDLALLSEPIERGFEAIAGVDGTYRWFTRTEGSADYMRLLRELPTSHRIE
ncbi:MAG: hypothetical protein IT353_02895 [Gemmatimonadaceae bacterium]|nr:hypothetical protein [Gemmatimonadaceae bacterium]